MGRTFTLEEILEAAQKSHAQLDRDGHFEAFCQLKLGALSTHAEKENLLTILCLLHEWKKTYRENTTLTSHEIFAITKIEKYTVARNLELLVKHKLVDKVELEHKFREISRKSDRGGILPKYGYILNRDFYAAWLDQAPHRLRKEVCVESGMTLVGSKPDDETSSSR